MHPSKKGSVATITSPKHTYRRKSLIFVTRWYCTYNSSTDTNAFFMSYLIVYDCTGHVEGSCLRTDIQLPQQTVIIRIASQGVFTKCSIFQSGHLIVTVEFTPFWGHLQLDHPVTCEIVKCYSHIQILAWIKNYNFLLTCFL